MDIRFETTITELRLKKTGPQTYLGATGQDEKIWAVINAPLGKVSLCDGTTPIVGERVEVIVRSIPDADANF